MMKNVVDDLEDEKSKYYKEKNKLDFFADNRSVLPKENIYEIKQLMDKNVSFIEKKIDEIDRQISIIQKECKHDFVDSSDDRSNFTYYQCTKCNKYKGN